MQAARSLLQCTGHLLMDMRRHVKITAKALSRFLTSLRLLDANLVRLVWNSLHSLCVVERAGDGAHVAIRLRTYRGQSPGVDSESIQCGCNSFRQALCEKRRR